MRIYDFYSDKLTSLLSILPKTIIFASFPANSALEEMPSGFCKI